MVAMFVCICYGAERAVVLEQEAQFFSAYGQAHVHVEMLLDEARHCHSCGRA